MAKLITTNSDAPKWLKEILVSNPVTIAYTAPLESRRVVGTYFNDKLDLDLYRVSSQLANTFGFLPRSLSDMVSSDLKPKLVIYGDEFNKDYEIYPFVIVSPTGEVTTIYSESQFRAYLRQQSNIWKQDITIHFPKETILYGLQQFSYCRGDNPSREIPTEVDKAFLMSKLDLSRVITARTNKRDCLPIAVDGRANKAAVMRLLRRHGLLSGK